MTVSGNPYVGLRPFDTDDSHLFFGRTDQVTALLESLHQRRFLGVVGSSGCGKSSLIKAGLIPALQGGFLIADREDWTIARLTPGDSPLENLASSLSPAFTARQNGGSNLRREIQADGVAAVRDRIAGTMSADTNLLILVDQFEEIFAFRGPAADAADDGIDPARRRAQMQRRAEAADFVALLLALAERPGTAIYVVATMRSDFLGDCDIFYGLPEAMNRGRYLVPRLSRKQLSAAIVGPARFGGGEIAPALVDRLLNELGDRFDRLPVLQHALQRTWEAWRRDATGGPVEVKHYEAAGTLEGALARHATEVLVSVLPVSAAGTTTIEPPPNATVRRDIASVFQSLTDTDAAGRQVKRRASLARIADETGLPTDRVMMLVRPFLDAGFLYSTVEVTETGETGPSFSLSHESLIRQWDTLQRWVTDERDSRDNYRELVALAAGEATGKKGLLRHPDLQFKRRWWTLKAPRRQWAARYGKREDEFDAASRYLERSVLWQRVRWTSGIASVVAVLVATGLLAGWALSQRDAARQKTIEAERSATAAQVSADAAATSAREAKTNLAAAVEAQAAAEANLALARKREEEVRQALTRADRNAEETRAALRDVARARDQAERNLQDATRARKLAEQKVEEREIAEIFARIDPQDVAALRDGLWKLTTATEPIVEQVLRKLLSTESTAQRLLVVGPSVVTALLGRQPAARAPLLARVVGDRCLDGYSSFRGDDAIARACQLLVRELGFEAAADADIGRRAMAEIERVSGSRDTNAFVLAFTRLGDALDPAQLSRLTATAAKPDSGNGYWRSYHLDFLVKFGDRLSASQARPVVDATVSDLLKSPGSLDNPSPYEFTEERMAVLTGRLDAAAARQLVDRVRLPSATANVPPPPAERSLEAAAQRARFLSFFALHLKEEEAVEAGRALLAGMQATPSGMDAESLWALWRLGSNLRPPARRPYAAVLLDWTATRYLDAARSSNFGFNFEDVAEVLRTLRTDFDRASVKTLAAAILATPADHATAARTRILVAIGEADALARMNRQQFEEVGRTFRSSPRRRQNELDAELYAAFGSAALRPDVLFAPGDVSYGSSFAGPFLSDMSEGELTTFLGRVPDTPAATQMIARQLNGMREARGLQLVKWLSSRAATSANLSEFWSVAGDIRNFSSRFQGVRPDLTTLVDVSVRALSGKDDIARQNGRTILGDLVPWLTDEQAASVVRVLAGRLDAGAEGEAPLLARLGPMRDARDATKLVTVLWKQYSADGGQYDKSQLVPALASLGPHLDRSQRQAILDRLLDPQHGLADEEVTASLRLLVPALDANQLEAVRSAAERAVRGPEPWVDALLIAAIADRLPARPRGVIMQLVIDQVAKLERYPIDEGYARLQTLIPLLDRFDESQKQRILAAVAILVRRGLSADSRITASLGGFARMLPGARERIATAVLQNLEDGTMPLDDVLRLSSALAGTPVSLQQLWDLVNWPTLTADAYVGLVTEISRREKLPPDRLLRPAKPANRYPSISLRNYEGEKSEPDRWALSAWAAERRLSLAPRARPAGYD